MRVLVTGGAGYIGSHTCVELLREKHEVCIFDNFYNSKPSSIERIEYITKKEVSVCVGDVTSQSDISRCLSKFHPDAVIHFAGLKSVEESQKFPAEYFRVNVGGTATLLAELDKADIKKIIFSSSATVYGDTSLLPCSEDNPTSPNNVYGRSKLTAEELLRCWSECRADNKVVTLRYFNPVGADKSGLLGEDFTQHCSNLVPIILQVAKGLRSHVDIFGTDYETPDGTGVRDYVHVSDLARAHINAMFYIDNLKKFEIVNVGVGRGISVLELLALFEKVTGKKIPIQLRERRNGDVAVSFAKNEKALNLLKIKFNDDEKFIEDAWRWACNNNE
jgi:UDP-glucose 4-epimerase